MKTNLALVVRADGAVGLGQRRGRWDGLRAPLVLVGWALMFALTIAAITGRLDRYLEPAFKYLGI